MGSASTANKPTANAFDFIRVTAAFAVLYSHSYALFGLTEPKAWEQKYGTLAVAVFFAVSGALVCQSWTRDSNVLRFTARRALRIMPGLVVASAFTTFIAGAYDSSLGLGKYLGSPQTWLFFLNSALLPAGIPFPPGAFHDLPVPLANGSLWTLRYEVLMYALLVLIGLSRHFRMLCTVTFAICAAAWWIFSLNGIDTLQLPIPVIWRVGLSFDLFRIANLGSFFFGACCLVVWQADRRLTWTILFVTLAAGFLVSKPLWPVWLAIAIPVLTLAAAQRIPAQLVDLRGWDISYGIYVYAFPVQQLATRFCQAHELDWSVSLGISIVATTCLALLSWRFIERPALAFRNRIKAGKAA